MRNWYKSFKRSHLAPLLHLIGYSKNFPSNDLCSNDVKHHSEHLTLEWPSNPKIHPLQIHSVPELPLPSTPELNIAQESTNYVTGSSILLYPVPCLLLSGYRIVHGITISSLLLASNPCTLVVNRKGWKWKLVLFISTEFSRHPCETTEAFKLLNIPIIWLNCIMTMIKHHSCSSTFIKFQKLC